MRNPIRAIVMGLGITSSALAQNPGPEEKPKVPPASKTTPADKPGPSHLRTVINSEEEVHLPPDYSGTLELNNITVNNLIRLIEKMRTDDNIKTFVIREDAGKISLPRIVTCRDGLKEVLENLPAIEPKLAVEQLPQGGYVILTREMPVPQEEKTFAAFGLKEYLNRLTSDLKEVDNQKKQQIRQEAIQEIQRLIEDSFELQRRDGKEQGKPQVSIRIHPSTGVLLATGTPKELAMIRTTLQALGIPGSISGASQEWGPPRGGAWLPSSGGMMGGGMGNSSSMGGGFGSMAGGGLMGSAPGLPVPPSPGGISASPYPGTPNRPPHGGGFGSSPPAATSPAKPAVAPKKPGNSASAFPGPSEGGLSPEVPNVQR